MSSVKSNATPLTDSEEIQPGEGPRESSDDALAGELPTATPWRLSDGVKLLGLVLCFGLICAPLAQRYTSLLPENPLTENRKKIEYPAGNPVGNIFWEPDTTALYEGAYNDRYPLRDTLVRLKNQLDYWMFGESKEAVIGPNGFVYDIRIAEQQLPALNRLPVKEILKFEPLLVQLNQRLLEQGIRLIIIPVPLKNTVFPELFPTSRIKESPQQSFLIFREMLLKHPEIFSVDVYGLFKDQRDPLPFYKTDLHWSQYGSILVAKDLVRMIAADSKREVSWGVTLTPESREFSGGGDSTAMGTLFPITERIDFYHRAKAPLDFPMPVKTAHGSYAYFKPERDPGRAMLPPTFMLGNSYMLYHYDNGLVDHFESMATTLDYDHFQDILSGAIPQGTKYVVWQFWEGQLLVHMQSEIWWSSLGKEFSYNKETPPL